MEVLESVCQKQTAEMKASRQNLLSGRRCDWQRRTSDAENHCPEREGPAEAADRGALKPADGIIQPGREVVGEREHSKQSHPRPITDVNYLRSIGGIKIMTSHYRRIRVCSE